MSFLKNDPALKERRKELRRNQTVAEKALWARVRNKQFFGFKFFRQYSMGAYILDFYCPEIKLAVELDGGQHNLPESREYDAERSAYLNSNGIEVVRFWNNEVLLEMEGVLEILTQKANPSQPPLTSRGGVKDPKSPPSQVKRGLGGVMRRCLPLISIFRSKRLTPPSLPFRQGEGLKTDEAKPPLLS
jgi:very-short-patch-repair endonuclease